MPETVTPDFILRLPAPPLAIYVAEVIATWTEPTLTLVELREQLIGNLTMPPREAAAFRNRLKNAIDIVIHAAKAEGRDLAIVGKKFCIRINIKAK